MATTRRYQSDQRAGTPQGRDPFSYGQGIRAPAAPNIPMPPRPAGAPPGPPRIYEPRITPAEAQFEGQAKIASQLSKTLGAWGERFYDRAVADAEQSGLQAGTLAGGSGTIELNDEDTIYANAFNKGVMEAYKGRLQLDSKQTLSRFAIEHPDDVDAFDRMVDTYKVNTLKQQSDPQIQAYTSQKIDEYAFEYRNTILATKAERDRELSEAVWNESFRDLTLDLEKRIKGGDQALIANTTLEIQNHLEAGIASGFIDGDEASDRSIKVREDAEVQLYLEQFEKESRDGNADAAFLAFRNADDLDVSDAIRERVEQGMLAKIKAADDWREKQEKAQEEIKKAQQREMTAIGLELYGTGQLSMEWVNQQNRARSIDNSQIQMLTRLAESSEADIRSRMNADVELDLWQEIYGGVDNSDLPDIYERITNAVAAGIAPNTGASMFKTLADANYDAVTNTEEYKLAQRQIRTIVGKSTGGPFSGLFADDSTAQSVAAAERELFVMMQRHPDRNPLDIVNPIIQRAMSHLNDREVNPGIRPRFSAYNADGSYDLQGSNVLAEVAWTNEELDTYEFAEIIEQQKSYHQWEATKPDRKNVTTINEQDANLSREQQEADARAQRANQ
jgi:hypothetical protein